MMKLPFRYDPDGNGRSLLHYFFHRHYYGTSKDANPLGHLTSHRPDTADNGLGVFHAKSQDICAKPHRQPAPIFEAHNLRRLRAVTLIGRPVNRPPRQSTARRMLSPLNQQAPTSINRLSAGIQDAGAGSGRQLLP